MRSRLRSRWAALGLAVAAAVVAVVLVVALRSGGEESGPPAPPDDPAIRLVGTGLQSETIYHSPQRPGFTEWLGAWKLSGGRIEIAFTQATGPVDPRRRARAPANVLRALGQTRANPQLDFWGLRKSVEYLQSANGGRTWRKVRSDPFQALSTHGYTPQPTIALRDGTLLRRVNGYDLRYDPDVPHTAFLQRLRPGANRWTGRQVLLDPRRYTYQLSRIRRLRDGRLVAVGQRFDTPANGESQDLQNARGRLLLMSSDDEGRTWSDALEFPDGTQSPAPSEWDVAELPSGDLLGVIRNRDPGDPATQIRQQALLKKDGDRWRLTRVEEAPLEPSGHPELLATREGPILHIATTGIDYTSDGGQTWHRLAFTPRRRYQSQYYPRALQLANGRILVFGHRGGDDAYGEKDQAVVMDSFRLRVTAGTTRR